MSKKNVFNKNDTKLFDSIAKSKVYCSNCGHSVVMSKADRCICSWCQNYIYRTPQIEFKYKLLEEQNKINRNKRSN